MRTLYSNPNKRQKEASFLETFISVKMDVQIENHRRGNPPAPDFLFEILQKRIGLEVTSLVKDPLAHIRSAQDNCLRKASEIAKQHGLETVEVKVLFRSDHNRLDSDEAAKELIHFIKEKIPEFDGKISQYYYESDNKHLKYFREIIINLGKVNGHVWLPNHRFGRIYRNWLTIDPIPEIQSIIDKKQKHYNGYANNCDECWLLIGVNEWTAPEAVGITDNLENHVFLGDFRRLFFVRNIEGRVIELNIRRHV
jgi:hypothetical protein